VRAKRRKSKRFTPARLRRFEEEGRGVGTYSQYIPWHQVRRGDPASRGRSHLWEYRGRLRHLLSDGELGVNLCSTCLPDYEDSLEQLPLSLEASEHPLARYREGPDSTLYSGTLEVARQLAIRHPKVHGDGETDWWRLTTDLVLIQRSQTDGWTMTAVSFKYPADLKRARASDLLRLEQHYWQRRGVRWLLVTPEELSREVALTLRRLAPWALGTPVDPSCLEAAVAVARANRLESVTALLKRLQAIVGDFDRAQRALWQAVWKGALPIDLRRGWRPSEPLSIVSDAEFRSFNPIWSRRSAWS
jgi:TnsA endonuclease N terminal